MFNILIIFYFRGRGYKWEIMVEHSVGISKI